MSEKFRVIRYLSSGPAFLFVRRMCVSCLPLEQIDRNTPQIERCSLLLALQTVKDRTDDAYMVPPAGLLVFGAFVARLPETRTNRSARRDFAPLREDPDVSQCILHPKFSGGIL